MAAPQPPTRRQRTTLRMRLVFGGHFWQGIKVGRGLSLQFSGELANVLCIIQSVASYAVLLLHCMYRVDRQWCGFFPPAAVVAGQWCCFFATIFEISRLVESKFWISISGCRHHWQSTLCTAYRCDDQIMKTSGILPPAMYIYLFDPPKILKQNKAMAMNLL